MATATATMDDLVASLGGSMHVSPDLKALQEYLAQNIVRPSSSIPLSSPGISFRPIPPSRSTSSTRKPTSLPSSYSYPDSNMDMISQAYPSPISQHNSFFGSSLYQDDTTMNVSTPNLQRPGGPLRRSSSYGFGQAPPSPQTAYSNFEADAFAPLWQQQQQQIQVQVQDPWAKIRSAQGSNVNAFSQYHQHQHAGPSQQPTSGFGSFRPPQGFGLVHQHQNHPMGMSETPPTPPAEDDEEMMDEDSIDAEMDDYDDEEDTVERVMGITSTSVVMQGQGRGDGDSWARGRRKYQI
ncbi:hypothetical protein L486_00064 [Kwoniella mangroviensis CBS 10435]|uniref:Uncharacterized protein n=1 Tax=Kwoniella mangroviensis CBS 10435 TaxID=1331196 RepID=A0A1B9IY25_9TREE|nr:hypothetical protein L486_00064 [Kwoniella mangroviensis CBS 10435]OCF74819.1 hypothetical protein I204_05201 [Kwoniella mangroviensis CBS 8886]